MGWPPEVNIPNFLEDEAHFEESAPCGRLKLSMLIELWERLRGYHRWIQADAVIVSGERLRRKMGLPTLRRQSQFSSDLLMWKDARGETRFGAFVNQDTSPLYQLLEGETISILYDPTRPSRFYNRAHFLSWVVFAAKAGAAILLGGGFIVWRIWIIFKTHGR